MAEETAANEPLPHDGEAETRLRTGGGFRAWLQLVRLPAVFTALADVAAGFACQTHGFQPVGEFAALLTASGALYLGGMVLNDVFDIRGDAASRPERPLPSGRVPLRSATILGVGLLAAGVASAASVSWQGLWIALALALCIVAYNGALKQTLLGPIAMGGCRFLNVMLGAAVHDIASFVWEPPQLIVAAAIGIYVVGITWFARTEETTSRAGTLLTGAAIVNAGIVLLVAQFLNAPAEWAGHIHENTPGTTLAVIAVAIAFTINRRIAAAIRDPSPARVQNAVKLMLLSIITLDAVVVLSQTGDVSLALATAMLVMPALLLGRWIYIT